MSVYVDALADMGWILRGRRTPSCHMVADTLEELHAMADRIGLWRSWFQPFPKHSCPHYDLVPSKRAAAVAAGAIELDAVEFVELLQRRGWGAEGVGRARRAAAAKSEVPR